MSLKSHVQSLSDTQLIRVFLEFVHSLSLPYEKTSQQIAYKCYEATWILPAGKAMGYGRTESEAYNQALRNLFDFLLQENGDYNRQLRLILQTNQPQNKQKTRKVDCLQSQNNPITSKVQKFKQLEAKKYIHKTQYDNPDQKANTRELSYKKLTRSKSKKSDNGIITGTNFQSSKKLIFQPNPSPLKHRVNFQNNNVNASEKGKIKQKRNVYYSKIILNKSTHSQQSFTDNQSSKNDISEQLRAAKAKLQKLQQHLSALNRANEILRQNIEEAEQTQEMNIKPNKRMLGLPKESINHIGGQVEMENIEPSTGATLNKNSNDRDQSDSDDRTGHFIGNKTITKLKVPKLRLDSLPNYHKKNEKSLNESLLAMYNQKHQTVN